MLVRLLVPRATVAGPQSIGDEINTNDAEAIRMIEAGQAEPVRVKKTPEKAAKRPKVERSTK